MLSALLLTCGLLQAAPPPADQHLSVFAQNLSLNLDGGWLLWHDGCDERGLSSGRILERDGGRLLVAEADGGFYWPVPFPPDSPRAGLVGMGWVDAVSLAPGDAGLIAEGTVLAIDPHWPKRRSALAFVPFSNEFEQGWQCPQCGQLGPRSYGPCSSVQLPEWVEGHFVTRRMTIEGREAVIISRRLAPDFLEGLLFDRDTGPPMVRTPVARGLDVRGYFSPSTRCIKKLEGALEPFLRKQKRGRAFAVKQRSYKAQYAGFEAPGNMVFASYLCSELPNWDWSKYPYLGPISGGGDCYFQLVFDCGTETFSDFTISSQ